MTTIGGLEGHLVLMVYTSASGALIEGGISFWIRLSKRRQYSYKEDDLYE